MHAMSAIERVLSPPLCRPFRTKNLAQQDHEKPTLNADGYLEFAPGDIESPRNWPVWRRWLITFAMVALVINATFASSAPSGCVHSIANHFNVSTIAAALTITLFLLGYCAGPLFLAPLSELYGRRWVFYITFSLYIIFNFLCAFAPNFGSLLVGRFLSGTFVSSALSNGPGVLGDIWDTIDRGTAMGVWSTMIWVGPALGPVVGGFLELKKDWRWIFYVLLWFGGLTIPIMLTIPETHGPTILRHKARRIRKAQIPGFENIKARSEESDQSLTSTFKVALTRPCLLLFDPISFLCALYLSVVYMLLYMLFEIYPIVFQEKRGWNSGVGELPLIGTVVGALLGGLIVVIDSARQKRKVERGTLKMEDIEPESRMPMAMFGGIGFAACMFWLAWTAQYKFASPTPLLLPLLAEQNECIDGSRETQAG